MTLAPEAAAAPAASVTPSLVALPAGYHLVPCLIGRPDNAAHVWLPCPTAWCTIDHSTDRQVAVEDVWHSGDFVDIELPHRHGTELLTYFRLGVDPYSRDENKRRTFVFAEDGTPANGYYMDAEHVAAFCDQAIAQLEKLRALAGGIAA